MTRLSSYSILLLLLSSFVSHALAISQAGAKDAVVDWRISEYLEDQGKMKTLSDVQIDSHWEKWPESKTTPSFGFTRSAYWLKIKVDNSFSHPVTNTLSIGVPWIDEIDLYLISKGEVAGQWILGDQRYYKPEYFRSLVPSIDMEFQPGDNTIYLRINTVEALMAPIEISEREKSVRNEINKSYYFGAIYGAIFLIGLYNLFLYLSIKQNVYLYYVLFLAAFIAASASYNGILYHLFLYKTPDVATSIHPHLFILYQYTGLLFVGQFLSIKSNYPRIYRTFIYFAALLAIFQLSIFLFDIPFYAQSLSVLTASLYGFLLMLTGVHVFRSRGLASRLLTYGIISSVIGTIFATFSALGILPFYFYVFHAIEIGFVADAALLSFALAANMKLLTKEKEQMQLVLLEKESQKKYELEELVKQRTEKLEQANKQLKQLTITDELTQLLNRSGSDNHLKKNLLLFERYDKPFSIILMDIDHFKKINDRYGHQTGDQVLQAFSSLLVEHTRGCDICCRWGGEEFMIICPETSSDGAKQVAKNLNLKFNNSVLVQGIKVTSSIGIATVENGDDLDSIIKRADECLYRAKKQGRNTICC